MKTLALVGLITLFACAAVGADETQATEVSAFLVSYEAENGCRTQGLCENGKQCVGYFPALDIPNMYMDGQGRYAEKPFDEVPGKCADENVE